MDNLKRHNKRLILHDNFHIFLYFLESEEDDGDKKDDGDKAGEKKRTNKGGIFRRLAQMKRKNFKDAFFIV